MTEQARPAVAVMTGGGPHDGRWELPGGWYWPDEQPDTGGRYVLVRRFGEQYRGRGAAARPGKDGGLYEWRPDRWSGHGLPPGLHVDGHTGSIHGVPRQPGTYSGMVTGDG